MANVKISDISTTETDLANVAYIEGERTSGNTPVKIPVSLLATSNAPAAADFPTIVQASGLTLTLSDARAGMGFKLVSSGGSGVHVAMAVQSCTTTFDVLCRIEYECKYTNPLQAGLGVRNSSNGKIMSIAKVLLGTGNALEVDKWTSLTAFSANAASQAASLYSEIPSRLWLRIAGNGTNVTFYYSANGSDWQQLFTETIATFLGSIDQVGLFIDQENSFTMTGCMDWFEA